MVDICGFLCVYGSCLPFFWAMLPLIHLRYKPSPTVIILSLKAANPSIPPLVAEFSRGPQALQITCPIFLPCNWPRMKYVTHVMPSRVLPEHFPSEASVHTLLSFPLGWPALRSGLQHCRWLCPSMQGFWGNEPQPGLKWEDRYRARGPGLLQLQPWVHQLGGCNPSCLFNVWLKNQWISFSMSKLHCVSNYVTYN